MKKYITICLLLIFNCINLIAQNFSYEFQLANSAYSSIIDSSATIINSDELIIMGNEFEFDFAGKMTDTISIKSNGQLCFDSNFMYNFLFFNKEFYFDNEGEIKTVLAYKKEITAEQFKILKIEFKNVVLNVSNQKTYFNFQIVLYQDANIIEFRMGSIVGNIPDEACMFGLINMNNGGVSNLGFLLSGSAENPNGNLLLSNSPLVTIDSFPTEGVIYKFIKTGL